MSKRRLIPVADAKDPAVAEFTQIRERDLTRHAGQFVAEGTVVLRMLAAAHNQKRDFAALKILLLENRVEGVLSILDEFPQDIPVYVAPQSVIDEIAGFHLHRGVLAIGQRLETPKLENALAGLPENALVTVCAGISNHDNLGSIFRNSAAFAASYVLLDGMSCDPLYRKAIRVSVGSVLTVPYIRDGSIEQILQGLDKAGFQFWGLSPAGRTPLGEIKPKGRVALILGTEGEGLPPSLMERIHTARIPQNPELDSLNVATASGIALFQMASKMALIA